MNRFSRVIFRNAYIYLYVYNKRTSGLLLLLFYTTQEPIKTIRVTVYQTVRLNARIIDGERKNVSELGIAYSVGVDLHDFHSSSLYIVHKTTHVFYFILSHSIV